MLLGTQVPGATVLVTGATGGVGQLLTAKLLDVSGGRVGWGGIVGGWVGGLRLSTSAALPPPARPHSLAAASRPAAAAPAQRGYNVRAMTRSEDKARQLFGDAQGLSVTTADTRDPSTLPAALEGVDAVVSCTGTTAFPRWASARAC